MLRGVDDFQPFVGVSDAVNYLYMALTLATNRKAFDDCIKANKAAVIKIEESDAAGLELLKRYATRRRRYFHEQDKAPRR